MGDVNPVALIFDADPNHTQALQALAESIGYQCHVSTTDTHPQIKPSIVFICLDLAELDVMQLISLPDIENAEEIILMAEEDDQVIVQRAISAGATYFFCKPFDQEFLEPLLKDVFEEVITRKDSTDTPEIAALDQFGQLRGSSKPMRKLYRMLRKVAPTNASILIVGESGTGKELVAQTLHQLSDVAEAPFVAMNCAAVPKELFESELFGHEKGSFTGAERQHQGYFERADGGTLFLDELAEMPIELQAKLLRVLEVGAYRRVGGEQDIASNVRIVAATNREPEQAIAEALLREDLYYRIAQFPISLPPLRLRGADIEGLVQYFLDELNTKDGTSVSIDSVALDVLTKHNWPGNVRELRSAIENAFIMADGDISAKDLPDLDAIEINDELSIEIGESVEDAEKKLIIATLDANGGDKQAAADMLGLSLRTLYSRLSEYDKDDLPQATEKSNP